MEGRLQLADGGALTFDVLGAGPPLFLVSGLSGVASLWHDLAEALQRHFTVVLHDHRGTGRSSRCDRAYSVAGMADDLEALMEHLALGPAALVGHSTGGAIGQVVALSSPRRLTRLVLSATWARACPYFRRLFQARLEICAWGGFAAYRRHGALVLNAPYWIAANEQRFAAELSEAAPEHPLDATITCRRIEAILAHDTLDELHRIACPTLVVVARDDAVTPAYHGEALAAAIPGATLTVLPRGGHFLQRAEPAAYLSTLSRFLLPT